MPSSASVLLPAVGIKRKNSNLKRGRFAGADHGLDGVGLVLTADDEITGIDLDHCITDSGSPSDLAAEIVGWGETYAEISPSGEGIRLFARGKSTGRSRTTSSASKSTAQGEFLPLQATRLTARRTQ